jgi:hypothetical protein
MISRFEFLYIKARIKKIEDKLFEFEATNPLYQEWEKWIHLNKQEQEEILAKWDKYYEECKNSFWGKSFFYLREKFKQGINIKGFVERLKEEAKKRNIQPLKKPEGIDPFELFYSEQLNRYKSLKSELAKLKEVYDEYLPVYGRSDDNQTL